MLLEDQVIDQDSLPEPLCHMTADERTLWRLQYPNLAAHCEAQHLTWLREHHPDKLKQD